MKNRRHELYLVCAALVIAAVLILYNTFSAPSVRIASLPQTSAVTLPPGVPDVGVSEAAPKNAPASVVNINTATAAELQTLPGIGEVKAAAIILYREENGRFIAKEELLNVSGIGEKILANIAPYIIL